MRDKKSMCSCGHILDDHTTSFEIGNNLCANVGCGCSQFRPTRREPDSLKAGVLSLPDVVKSESNLPA